MHAATGHVILAHQTPEVTSRAVQIWCQQNNAQVPRDLAAHLNKIKRQGYEERESYQVNGIVNVSCPVFDDRGNANRRYDRSIHSKNWRPDDGGKRA